MKTVVAKFLILGMSFLAISPMRATFAQEAEKKFKPTFTPFLWLQSSFVNDETAGKNATFQLTRARLGASGMVREKISYHLMMEGVLGGKTTALLQAWMEYELHPLAALRIGQFKYPFGIEAYPSIIYWKFIDPSFVTNGITRELGRINPEQSSGSFRDIGVQLAGELESQNGFALGYKIMAMNGNGILQTDNNANNDMALRGHLKMPRGINLGASYFRGKFTSTTALAAFAESAFGVDVAWNHKALGRELRIQGEYILANYETSGDDIEPRGYYLYGAYFFLPKVELGIRYDAFQPNKNLSQTVNQKRTTLLAGYYFDKTQRITVNYEIRDDGLKGTDNILTALFQIAF